MPPPKQAHVAQPVAGAFKASGKTVVITGGSQGVGRATALLFAKKGYNVVVASRDMEKLRHTASDVAEAAGRQGAALAVPTDITEERSVRDLANTALSRYESIDVVVNCAGLVARGAFADTPSEQAMRLMSVNYLGAFHMGQAFMPILLAAAKRKGTLDKPSLVLLNSIAGKVPVKNFSALSASRFALTGLTAALRLELEPEGIHIAQIFAGMVSSDMQQSDFHGPDSADDRRIARQVLRALPVTQSPAEVASAIYDAVISKRGDVVVGLPFAAAADLFRLTGLNPSALV